MIQSTDVLSPNELEVTELSNDFEALGAEEILRWAIGRFGTKLALVSSFQAEGMAILDMAIRIDPNIRVATIDTGRLHEETYDFMQQVRTYYDINIEIYFPDAQDIQQMVSNHGVNLFYQDVDSRHLCCQVRKVKPLARALEGVESWITGLRREQSVFRTNTQKVELDDEHGGIVKLNPLADWTHEDLWKYTETYNVPQHPLYKKGYTSIGCAPCTRPIQIGEDRRAGRWWWEETGHKECGLHIKV